MDAPKDTAFRLRSISSPDFLKQHRNKDDWPEIEDHIVEEEGISRF